MEQRCILAEDVDNVIEASKKTGERFFNPEDGSYLANLRIGNITCWVRYAEREDGFEVLSTYSHRMKVDSD